MLLLIYFALFQGEAATFYNLLCQSGGGDADTHGRETQRSVFSSLKVQFLVCKTGTSQFSFFEANAEL